MKMKKLLLVALCLMMGSAAFAQEDENGYSGPEDVVYTSSDGKFQFDVVSHIGFGFAHVTSDDFLPWKWHSGEFFVNLVDLCYRPFTWVGIEAGIDFETMEIASRSSYFMLNSDKRVFTGKFSSWANSYDDTSSSINAWGFSAPILLKGFFGKASVGLGVNLQMCPWGNTTYSTQKDNIYTDITMKKAELTPFTYSLMATLTYNNFLGVYFRYYPSQYAVVPQHTGSPKFGLMTMGVALGF